MRLTQTLQNSWTEYHQRHRRTCEETPTRDINHESRHSQPDTTSVKFAVSLHCEHYMCHWNVSVSCDHMMCLVQTAAACYLFCSLGAFAEGTKSEPISAAEGQVEVTLSLLFPLVYLRLVDLPSLSKPTISLKAGPLRSEPAFRGTLNLVLRSADRKTQAHVRTHIYIVIYIGSHIESTQ